MTDQIITLEQAIVLLFASTCPSFTAAVLAVNHWGFSPTVGRLLFWLVFGLALTIAYPVVTSQPLEQSWLQVIWLAVLAFMFKIYLSE